ncbi:ATP-binding protein [Larkinella insperata]|uniref:histidine kinase n=1 Tax=Larkinella insperata TaxID=332158 RepID=A0ABW3QCI9_9BACT
MPRLIVHPPAFWWMWVLLRLAEQPALAQPTALPQPQLITDRQGLPQGFVPGIVQDQQGFIWMATHDGLCRYDGNRFKVFRQQTAGPSSLPFSSVEALRLDHRGRIWVTSEQKALVLFDPRTEAYIPISRQLAGLPFSQVPPVHYYADRQNRLWMTYYGLGIVCYDLTTRRYRWFRHRANDPRSLGSDRVRSVIQDQQGSIWISTEDAGLERFDEKTGYFLHYRPDSPTPLALPELGLYDLYQHPSGELLFGTHHYVCQFNPKTGRLRSYRLPAGDDPAWPEHYQWGMHFATDSRGVVYLDQRDRLFRFTERDGPQLLTRFTPQTGFCMSLLIDRSDVLWVGTDGSGVRKYDLRADGFQTARYQTDFQSDVAADWLKISPNLTAPTERHNPYMFRYTLDHQGQLWFNVGSSVFYRINPLTHQGERVDFPIPFGSIITPLATDEQGRVWALQLNEQEHYRYFWYYDGEKHQWIRSSSGFKDDPNTEIIQLVADLNAFWFATNNQGLIRFDRRTGHLRKFLPQSNQPTSLSSNHLYCLSADPDDPNRLWIGTFGQGLCAFDKRSGRCRRITQQQGLPNNVIYSALPDGHGNLWIGTNKGLCRMNRKTFQTRTYTTEDGLMANEFNRFHYLHLPNGQIIMGGVEGITAFQPATLQDDRFQPRVELTELYVNNQLAQPDSASFLPAPIQAIDQLNLAHNQNFLTVQFAAVQFNRPGKNRYRYRLEGVDNDWVETAQPQAIYTTLAPDHYTLLVNASNTSGVWSPHVRRLGITISPPFWKTWWAYGLYILVVTGSIWYAIRLRLNQLQLQQSVALRQQEARQLRELDQMKSRFFTNVTHDFRTPLTLFLSPVAGLLEDLAGTRYAKRLESMSRNAQQLLGLINQLLDFSKLDAGALTVQEVRGDVGQFVEQTLFLFGDEAARKTITVRYQNDLPGAYWFDADKLQRILTNLLGNALKFTPAGGEITVSIQAAEDVLLTVSDTGAGIAPDQQPRIFDRFFQGYAPADDVAEPSLPAAETPQPVGTGIGLALVKELVELQNGSIAVESQPDQGTTFHIHLPYRRADSVPAPVAALVHPSAMSSAITSPGVANQPNGGEPLGEHPFGEHPLGEPVHLLLVEDNPELAEFIAESLPAHYRVSQATNGVEGLQQALDKLPDLVISDVMMPLMDGYTLCQKLKDDERTNHIPVILLTAKVTLDNRLEGLTRGADEYLTKPFHVPELNLRIHNLLERQRRLRERIRQELSQPDRADGQLVGAAGDPYQPSAPTDAFLQKLYAKVEEKLDDSTFSVEDLAEQMAMSRVSLHKKVKALTGLPASEVMRQYRLKRATQFLRQGLNSSETAYRVGFESPAYFSKCFRELYGKTPLEYAKNP